MSRDKSSIQLGDTDALIVVDVQIDFLPGGALGVQDGDEAVPVLNDYLGVFRQMNLPVYATRDWHPEAHCSFKEQGGIWPVHCLAGTEGAQFANHLQLDHDVEIISKATTVEKDAYSGFDNTDLEQRLRDNGVKRIFVGGLATDYCVLNTVLDGLKAGFQVYYLADASRAVNVSPGDGDKAIEKMLHHGAQAVTLDRLAS